MAVEVRETFEALEPLDLKKCGTVGELVRAMSQCSFVARQLGEVAGTIHKWIVQGRPVGIVSPILHHPVNRDDPNIRGSALRFMSYNKHGGDFRLEPEGYLANPFASSNRLLVVGRFSEYYEPCLVNLHPETIFINREGLARPGQIQDGYFPSAVFEDPHFVVPVILAALDEWLGIKTWTVTELFASMSELGGVAAEAVQGAKVLKAMIDDPECAVFMTASGAMTIVQLDYLFCDMMEEGMIQCLTTTGALMAHGLVKSAGLKQFKHRPEHGDALYAEQKINRVTDTLEPEENFDHVDQVMNAVFESLMASWDLVNDRGAELQIGPSDLHRAIGQHLVARYPAQRGILKSAFERQVPVFVPAFVDSELGNDVYCFNARRRDHNQPTIVVNPELDSARLMELALGSKRLGIFSLGGGVPGNNSRNIMPLISLYRDRLNRYDLPERRYHFSVRIYPDEMQHGHFSSCTGSEMISWRKAWPDAEICDVHADATVTWPFMLKWVMENRAQ